MPDSEAEPHCHAGAALPASNIPIRVPTHFIGRDDALEAIRMALKRHEGRVAITALHGLPGVGKTTPNTKDDSKPRRRVCSTISAMPRPSTTTA